MMNVNLSLSDSDVKTLIFCLQQLVHSDIADTEVQNEINDVCSISAIQKLSIGSTDILPNEFRVMYTSLLYVQCICNGSVNAEPSVRSECSNYMFSINKLVSRFSSEFPDLE